MNINEILQQKLDSRMHAIKAADERSAQLRLEIPEIAAIDNDLHAVTRGLPQ